MHAKLITQIKRYLFIALRTPISKERGGCTSEKLIPTRHGSTRQAGGLCLYTALQPQLFQNVII